MQKKGSRRGNKLDTILPICDRFCLFHRCNEKTEAMFRMLKNEKIMQKIEYFQHCGNFLGWSERPILTKRVLTQEHDEDSEPT